MIQRQTLLKITDNSGARIAKVIGIPGYSNRKTAKLGDTVVVAVQRALPNAALKRHDVEKAVIVRVRKEHNRKDGTYVRFDDNAAVIIDKKGAPKGTRIFGPVARELKENGFDKIVSLAPEVL
jgi:large subunit ribosomal protein L14